MKPLINRSINLHIAWKAKMVVKISNAQQDTPDIPLNISRLISEINSK